MSRPQKKTKSFETEVATPGCPVARSTTATTKNIQTK